MSLVDSATIGAINSTHPPPPPATQSCKLCTALEKLFAEDNVEIKLDKDDFKDQSCTEHGTFFQWMERNCYEHFTHVQKARFFQFTSNGIDTLGSILLSRVNGKVPRLRAHAKNLLIYRDYEVLLQPKTSPGKDKDGHSFTMLDPDWIDLSIAKEWMKKCFKEHESKCQDPKEKFVSPAWLIDTKDDCLVPRNDSRPFVALSYRWGSSTTLQMNKDVFENLKSPGSLSLNNVSITATVQDAIHTVRIIGERYLWVDAVCIAPDDEKQLAAQLQLMGGIYSSAKLTIVVLDGDARSGIKGLNSQSSKRKLSNILPWKDKSVVVRQLPALSAQNVLASEYFQRGWTFQEYTLSQRRLIFGDQQIHWQCSCSTSHEDLPRIRDRVHTLRFPNIKRGWLDFHELGVLLNEYNNRELTFPEDAFPAVNGLLTYLERYSFEHGFLFGLPRAVFDAALMWSDNIGDIDKFLEPRPGLCRRQPSERHHSILPNTYLPSWSWIGWRGGNIEMLDTEAQFQWSRRSLDSGRGQLAKLMRSSVITIPITQWYNHASPDGTDKQLIPRYPTVYKESPEIAYDTEVWRVKGPIKDEACIPMGVGGKHIYEHAKFPGRSFLWPLPKVSTEEHGGTAKLQQYPFISCHTNRAWFGGLQQSQPNFKVRMHTQLCLFDKQKRLCGWLQLPKDSESRNFPNANVTKVIGQLSETPLGVRGTFMNPFPECNELLELVAICRRKCSNSSLWQKWVQWEEYYGVLWVQWIDGVAYRRGCGYVQKELWEEQDLEDIDLILG